MTIIYSGLIDGVVGQLEILIEDSSLEINSQKQVRGVAIVAHPHPQHGGSMTNKVSSTIAKAFNSLGIITLKFNFRGVGKSQGDYGGGIGELEDFMCLTNYLHSQYPQLPIYAGGFSFGALIAANAFKIANNKPNNINFKQLVLAGTAIHPTMLGKNNNLSNPQVPANTILIHGNLDETILLSDVLNWASPQKLIISIVTGSDHFFHQRLGDIRTIVHKNFEY